MTAVTVHTEVEIHLDELVDSLTTGELEQLQQLVKARMVPDRAADGRSFAQIIDAAYARTKATPSLPRELIDLFWIVHGRALA